MTQTLPALNAALQITHEAVKLLAEWGNTDFVNKFPDLRLDEPDEQVKNAVNQAKKILFWPQKKNLQPLRLLFDRVKLTQGQTQEYYWPLKAIEDRNPTIPYPQTAAPTNFDSLKAEITRALESLHLSSKDCENLSLLNLILEKFGSFISFGESDVALVDMARTTAAVAAALATNRDGSNLNLVAGDLSGIQKFIYTISSDGALKSLRARSFYLELVAEEVVQQLLTELKLPRSSVIYAGGGNLYLLANGTEEIREIVKKISQKFNEWLLEAFQGKIFLALDCLQFPIADIVTKKFAGYWSDITTQLSVYKSRKFADQISEFIKPRNSFEPCRVCHRDDIEKLERLNDKDPDSVLACETCCSMFRLGSKLLHVDAIVRSPERKNIPKAQKEKLTFKLPNQTIYYYFFHKIEDLGNIQDSETIFLVNNWKLEKYRSNNCVTFLTGNYSQESEELGSTISSREMAERAKGIPRITYLRMDVDRLGQIFIKGLSTNQTLPSLAALSRSISYFFKVYLNSLAENRHSNFIYLCESKSVKVLNYAKYLTKSERKNLLFIYAGGDDIFVSGAWNEVVEFAFDVYQCFRAYTGHNPDITLSAGISIDNVKVPIYQTAYASGYAEDKAKSNGRDSLCLFDQVFKWDEWLGNPKITEFEEEVRIYLHSETQPSLWGILPFVQKLLKEDMGVNYSRNFVRNLLITAQIQEQALEKFKEDQKSQEALGMRYYLHLPKIAYTLTRLPKRVLEDSDFRTSLKSPYNAPYFRAIATWIELLNRR
jgi:CRISPR-associated protein Csm1